MVDIEANLRDVHRRIAEAAERGGRDPSGITLVAVTKLRSVEDIKVAYELGVRHFGENRVHEAAEKIPIINRWLETKTLYEEYESKHKWQKCSTHNENSLRKIWKHPQTASMHYSQRELSPENMEACTNSNDALLRQQTEKVLVAASKRRDFSLPSAGGESFRLEECASSPLTWHMVGHLQRRKAKDAIHLFDIIHSVDTLKLARRLDRLCEREGRVMPVLLEANVSGDDSKYGFALERWEGDKEQRESFFAVVDEMLALPNIEVQGLMTMAPIVTDPEDARPYFRRLRELRDELCRRFATSSWRHLSMGMTDDFEVAVEEGATMVRIGRAIFGERPEV